MEAGGEGEEDDKDAGGDLGRVVAVEDEVVFTAIVGGFGSRFEHGCGGGGGCGGVGRGELSEVRERV